MEAVQRGAFDLVLMDCQMPIMDGFEATRRIRSSDRTGICGLPIIAVTADAMSDERDRCFTEGMNEYLAKPVELGPLQDVLARWLPASHAGDGAQTPGPLAGQTTQTVFDAEGLLRRVMGDRQLASTVIQGFLAAAPAKLRAVYARGSLNRMPLAPGLKRTNSKERQPRLRQKVFARSHWRSSGKGPLESWTGAASVCPGGRGAGTVRGRSGTDRLDWNPGQSAWLRDRTINQDQS